MKTDLRWERYMEFGLARAPMLDLLAKALEIPEKRQSAFLGKFQHLQRLKLVEGINPGRGKAAEYQAHHLMIIAITMQLLQLGLTPERAVSVVRANQDRIQLSIAHMVKDVGELRPTLLWFDAALLTQTSGETGPDLAEVTLDWGDFDRAQHIFSYFFQRGLVQRMAFVSVHNTLHAFVRALLVDDDFSGLNARADSGEKLVQALRDWGEPTSAAIIAKHDRARDMEILRELKERGSPAGPKFAEAVGLSKEWLELEGGSNG